MKRPKLILVTTIGATLVVWCTASHFLMLPPLSRRAERSNTAPCAEQLHQIRTAIATWQAATGRPTGEPVVVDDVNQYLDGQTTPHCPSGGTYSYGQIGGAPTCSCAPGMSSVKVKRRVAPFKWTYAYVLHKTGRVEHVSAPYE